MKKWRVRKGVCDFCDQHSIHISDYCFA